VGVLQTSVRVDIHVVTTDETPLDEHRILAWEAILFSTMNVERTGQDVARRIEKGLNSQTFAGD